MKKTISKSLLFFFSLLLLAVGSCGDKEQLSGVVGTLLYSTAACVPQDELIRVRNTNTEEAQRVIGIQIEPGTNDDKFFKLVSIKINEQEETAIANLVPDIIIPPGGVMDVKVTYNPKTTTLGDEFHTAYVDVVLGNPLVGVQQFALKGQALTAKEGCGAGGNTRQFEVLSASGVLSHTAGGEIDTPLTPGVDIGDTLTLDVTDSDQVVLTVEGFPSIDFPLPEGTTPSSLPIVLSDDSQPVDFGGDGSLTFDGLKFSGGGVINLSGLKMTTDTITITPDQAPNVANGSLSRSGSPLNTDGEMTLVVLAGLPTTGVLENQDQVKGGGFGLVISLKEIQ